MPIRRSRRSVRRTRKTVKVARKTRRTARRTHRGGMVPISAIGHKVDSGASINRQGPAYKTAAAQHAADKDFLAILKRKGGFRWF